MSRNKNAKSPTAALRERVTATYGEMRGTPEGGDTPGNPWDMMLKADEHQGGRLPRLKWSSLAVWLAAAAVVVGLILWLI